MICKTMVISALLVELLTGASYCGDPSTDGPPTKSEAQSISFAPSAHPGDINSGSAVSQRWNLDEGPRQLFSRGGAKVGFGSREQSVTEAAPPHCHNAESRLRCIRGLLVSSRAAVVGRRAPDALMVKASADQQQNAQTIYSDSAAFQREVSIGED